MNLTDQWNYNYKWQLSDQGHNRCFDCVYVRIGTMTECQLLNIVIANARKSRCPGHVGRTGT